MSLLSRIRDAAHIVRRGVVAPFDRIQPTDGLLTAGPMQEPYRTSVWVYAAIRQVTRPCTAVSLRHSVRRAAGPGDEVLTDPRIENFWARPAKGYTWPEFLAASITWRKLAGECFWLLSDGTDAPFPEARAEFPPMIFARPDRMRHLVENGEVVAWEFTDGTKRRHVLSPDQVVHLRQFNPHDDVRGLGDWESARLAAETDHASGTYCRNLAHANGDQGAYVVAKNGVMDDAQRKQITELLREKRRLQQQGIFRPVFLTGDIAIEDPKARFVDAAFLEGRRMSAGEVFVAFGVPPGMAREQASYSIGGASDYHRLILDACIPESEEIAQAVARVSTRLLRRKVWAWFAWEEHPVMQEVRRERVGSIDALWSKGMPIAEISRYMDLALPRYASDERGFLPMTVVSNRSRSQGNGGPA
jgi:hypothetical protein